MAKQKTVTVNGKEFILQHPGARWYLNLQDRCKNRSGVLLTEKYTEELLENVVVDPKMKLDDFDEDIDTVEQLVVEVERFLRGK